MFKKLFSFQGNLENITIFFFVNFRIKNEDDQHFKRELILLL